MNLTLLNGSSVRRIAEPLPQYPPVMRRHALEPGELSFGQRRLWMLSQLGLASVAYNVPLQWRLTGPLNRTALEQSLNEIVRRHDVLRTCYLIQDEQPVQVVTSGRRLTLQVVDLELVPSERRDEELQTR